MKKILTSTAFLVLVFSINTDAQIRFGILGGPALSNVSLLNNGSFEGGTGTNYHLMKNIVGYDAGIVADHRLGRSFAIRPMLLWTLKGWNRQTIFGEDGRVGDVERYRIHYLQLPLNIIYTTPVGNGKVYIGGGPYIAYGINGRFWINNIRPGYPYSKIRFGNKEAISGMGTPIIYVKRLDYGLDGNIGYELNSGFFIHLEFDYGLQAISSSYFFSPNAKYRIFKLDIGYLLNRKKK